ncbi:site-specific integrase [Skermania sp. ID1734]|uniref:tyrosine-type recombinase/integrase n=1 Tax=Skermania sp. ID1734 TaxID=2597516 RepID=UPI0021035DCE|nr:site-specific integrase [Skermania sp. ID1734]
MTGSVPAMDGNPILAAWTDLADREVAVGIGRGDPFMVGPDGRVDPRLTRFFSRSSFARLAPATKVSYTNDYRVFFNFLWMRGKVWDATDYDDLFDFEDWRRRAPHNPARISGAKWNRELAALQRLFGWAVSQRLLDANPVQVKTVRNRYGDPIEVAQARAKDVRSSNVRWLTPRAYRLWRDVGLRGYTGEDRRDPSWRGRHDDRNAAFADVLFCSGLRRTEAASLLVTELPQATTMDRRYVDARLASAVAKNGRARTFYLSAQVVADVQTYVATSRRAVVRLAQQTGRYEDLPEIRVLTHQSGRMGRVLHWKDRRGQLGQAGLDNLDPDERRLLFVTGPDGIEPLWLWLAQDGSPSRPHSWEAVFRAGSQRCATMLAGKVTDPPFCTPHMCRHSFALHMLVALHHAMDRKFGLTAEERRDYRLLYGDPWRMVKDLLGHASEQTTRDIYLAPVADLQIRSLLTGDDDPDVAELLTRIAAASERIIDREDIA